MKKLITILGVTLVMVSCKEEKQYEFDNFATSLIDTTIVDKGFPYYKKIQSPTRGVFIELEIKNSNDTAKKFEVSIKEIK